MSDAVIPWTVAHQVSLSFTTSQSLLKFMSTDSVMLSNHLILCALFSFCLQSSLVSGSFRISALCLRWTKYWSFSFSINLSSEYSGLISLRIDWFYLFAVQGTLKGILQHHSLKASILQHSAFFIVQILNPYMTTGKTTALTYRPLSAKWCLCFLIHCLDFS